MVKDPRTLLAIPALTAALALTACGASSSTAGGTAAGTASMSMSDGASMSMDGGTSSPSEPASSNAPAATVQLTISGFAFHGTASVPPGATVHVTNRDSEAHTVTSDDGTSFNVKVDGGGSATFTAPSTPGSYPYHCQYHANMHGSLQVS